MADDIKRYSLDMHFALKTDEGQTMWKLDNDYEGLDYGQVVAAQAVVAEVAAGLIGLGIIQAEEKGFSVADMLDNLKAMRDAQR